MPGRELLDAAQQMSDSLVKDRRTIHACPELMYEEHRTAAFVAQRLQDLGLKTRTGVGRTGVMAVLEGSGGSGRRGAVLLRADMDALPIQELSDIPYKSQNEGAMHACGHDGHVASLLGAARLLVERRNQFAGSVTFMFQPAEEGGAGALRMIEDGLLESPKVEAAFALHVDPQAYTGQIATRVGPTMASADRFIVDVQGLGGHAARPHLGADPIVIASQVVSALQTLVSREVAPYEPAVVTIGKFHSGTAFNIIPNNAVIEGTVRALTPEVRDLLEQRLTALAAGVAQGMKGKAVTEYIRLYPPLINHQSGVDLVEDVVGDLLGREAVVQRDLEMGAEDFAFLLERVPGAMFYLGVRDRSWETPRAIHNAEFDMDERALPIGAAMMAGAALRYLQGE